MDGVYRFPEHFKFTAPAGWETLNALGFSILGIILMVMCIRETLNLIGGRHADFYGVLARGVIAAVMLAVVPWAANFLGGTAMRVGALLHGEASGNMETALRMAFGAVQCDDVGALDALGMIFSLRGITTVLAFVVFLFFLLVKIAVIDVAWKIVFSIVVFQAPLTLPLGTLEQFGGFSLYWRNVLGVAVWPITFSMIVALGTASFQNTINNMASGATRLECAANVEMAGEESGEEGGRQDGGMTASLLGFVKFLGLLLAMMGLTLSVPQISAMVVGGQPAGMLGIGALGAILGGAASVGGAGAKVGGAAVRRMRN